MSATRTLTVVAAAQVDQVTILVTGVLQKRVEHPFPVGDQLSVPWQIDPVGGIAQTQSDLDRNAQQSPNSTRITDEAVSPAYLVARYVPAA